MTSHAHWVIDERARAVWRRNFADTLRRMRRAGDRLGARKMLAQVIFISKHAETVLRCSCGERLGEKLTRGNSREGREKDRE